MSTTSNTTVITTFTGDVEGTEIIADASNLTSAGQTQYLNLVAGFNSITIPSNAQSVTIYPPATNTVAITLKGVTGDTGISLSPVNSIKLPVVPGTTVFGLTIGTGGINQVLFVWS